MANSDKQYNTIQKIEYYTYNSNEKFKNYVYKSRVTYVSNHPLFIMFRFK